MVGLKGWREREEGRSKLIIIPFKHSVEILSSARHHLAHEKYMICNSNQFGFVKHCRDKIII